MKKLSLGKLRLSGEEVLGRSQLANIYGGSGGSGSELILCTCKTSSGGTTPGASCTSDLAGDGTNRCCSTHYGSNSQQSGTGCT
ncbi:hypothetical protein [Algoriphagus antarcticus]|uniref:Natural product n=1 Tax=Algoriphagus antarcticus TaxID=238540 RepID=A0A3E0DNY9_9BACT|nr:hypothetical protein [Algoriphagus antarcticus]REG84550.1 hypothetical protein C8N25_115130 [Algoriphagus antarcticus]